MIKKFEQFNESVSQEDIDDLIRQAEIKLEAFIKDKFPKADDEEIGMYVDTISEFGYEEKAYKNTLKKLNPKNFIEKNFKDFMNHKGFNY